jgi:hypothetical protein
MVAACGKSDSIRTRRPSISQFQGRCPEKIFLNKIEPEHSKSESRKFAVRSESSIEASFASTNPNSRPSNYRLSTIGSVRLGISPQAE